MSGQGKAPYWKLGLVKARNWPRFFYGINNDLK
jgi:hypothetical protein